MKDILALFRLARGEKKLLVLSLGCSAFVAFFTYVFVNLVQPIMDKLFQLSPGQTGPQKTRFMDTIFRALSIDETQLVRLLPLVVLVVIFGKGMFTFLSSYFMKAVGHRVAKGLRDDLFTHLVHQSNSFFDRMPTGDLMSRLTNDVDKIHQAISGSMSDFIEELFILFALLVGVFVIDFRLAIVSFVVTPIAVIPLALFSRQLKKKSLVGQKKMSQIYNLLHEAIAGNAIIKSFTSEEFEVKKFLRATAGYFRTSMKLAWIGSLSSPFMEFIGGVVGAFILTGPAASPGPSAPEILALLSMAIFMMYTDQPPNWANNVIQQAVACNERFKRS
jgi:subfamily B ATP-binding cassette protein MsbA